MRSLDDIAIRTRNGFWYYQVRKISRLKDAALDRKAFGEDCERRRHFEGIRRSWSSPCARQIFAGRTLLQVVDAWDTSGDKPGPYAETTKNFRSMFWKFVTQPKIPLDDYTEHIQRYVREEGLVRLDYRGLRLCETFLSACEPAVQCGTTPAYSAMLDRLARVGTLDAMSVLIALFREATGSGSLDQAIAIRETIRHTLRDMRRSGSVPREVGDFVWALVESRVIANHWVSVDDWKSSDRHANATNRSSTERIRAFDRYRTWFLFNCIPTCRGYGVTPIATATPGVTWVEQNRDALFAALEVLEISMAAAIHASDYGDTGLDTSTYRAEVTRILARLPPRPVEPQACFCDPKPPAQGVSDREEDPRALRESRIARLIAGSWPRRTLDSRWFSGQLARGPRSPAP